MFLNNEGGRRYNKIDKMLIAVEAEQWMINIHPSILFTFAYNFHNKNI